MRELFRISINRKSRRRRLATLLFLLIVPYIFLFAGDAQPTVGVTTLGQQVAEQNAPQQLSTSQRILRAVMNAPDILRDSNGRIPVLSSLADGFQSILNWLTEQVLNLIKYVLATILRPIVKALLQHAFTLLHNPNIASLEDDRTYQPFTGAVIPFDLVNRDVKNGIRHGFMLMRAIAIGLLLILFILTIWKYWTDASWKNGHNLMGAVARLITTAGLILFWPVISEHYVQITNEMIDWIFQSIDLSSLNIALDRIVDYAVNGAAGLIAGLAGAVLARTATTSVGAISGGALQWAGAFLYFIFLGVIIYQTISFLVLKAVQTALMMAQFMFAPLFLCFFVSPDTERITATFVKSCIEVSLWTFVWVGLLRILVVLLVAPASSMAWGQFIMMIGILQIMISVPQFLAQAQISPVSEFISPRGAVNAVSSMVSGLGDVISKSILDNRNKTPEASTSSPIDPPSPPPFSGHGSGGPGGRGPGTTKDGAPLVPPAGGGGDPSLVPPGVPPDARGKGLPHDGKSASSDLSSALSPDPSKDKGLDASKDGAERGDVISGPPAKTMASPASASADGDGAALKPPCRDDLNERQRAALDALERGDEAPFKALTPEEAKGLAPFLSGRQLASMTPEQLSQLSAGELARAYPHLSDSQKDAISARLNGFSNDELSGLSKDEIKNVADGLTPERLKELAASDRLSADKLSAVLANPGVRGAGERAALASALNRRPNEEFRRLSDLSGDERAQVDAALAPDKKRDLESTGATLASGADLESALGDAAPDPDAVEGPPPASDDECDIVEGEVDDPSSAADLIGAMSHGSDLDSLAGETGEPSGDGGLSPPSAKSTGVNGGATIAPLPVPAASPGTSPLSPAKGADLLRKINDQGARDLKTGRLRIARSSDGRSSIDHGQRHDQLNFAEGTTGHQQAMGFMMANMARMVHSDSGAERAALASCKGYRGGNLTSMDPAKRNYFAQQLRHEAAVGTQAYFNGESGNQYTEFLRGTFGPVTDELVGSELGRLLNPALPDSPFNTAYERSLDRCMAAGLTPFASNLAVASRPETQKMTGYSLSKASEAIRQHAWSRIAETYASAPVDVQDAALANEVLALPQMEVKECLSTIQGSRSLSSSMSYGTATHEVEELDAGGHADSRPDADLLDRPASPASSPAVLSSPEVISERVAALGYDPSSSLVRTLSLVERSESSLTSAHVAAAARPEFAHLPPPDRAAAARNLVNYAYARAGDEGSAVKYINESAPDSVIETLKDVPFGAIIKSEDAGMVDSLSRREISSLRPDLRLPAAQSVSRYAAAMSAGGHDVSAYDLTSRQINACVAMNREGGDVENVDLVSAVSTYAPGDSVVDMRSAYNVISALSAPHPEPVLPRPVPEDGGTSPPPRAQLGHATWKAAAKMPEAFWGDIGNNSASSSCSLETIRSAKLMGEYARMNVRASDLALPHVAQTIAQVDSYNPALHEAAATALRTLGPENFNLGLVIVYQEGLRAGLNDIGRQEAIVIEQLMAERPNHNLHKEDIMNALFMRKAEGAGNLLPPPRLNGFS